MSVSIQQSLSMEKIWNQTLAELKGQMVRGTFDLHFNGSFPVEMDDERIVVTVRSKHSVEAINAQLLPIIKRTLRAIMGVDMEVDVVSQSEMIREMKKKKANENGSENGRSNGNGSARNGKQALQQEKSAAETEEENRVQIKGKPTRASAVPNASFLQVSHYAIRFWQPVIGCRAFTVWQVINSFKVGKGFNWNGEPMINELMSAAGISNHAHFKEALNVLIEFGLLEISERDDNKKSKYQFEIFDFPLLSFRQHFDYLKERKQSELHLQWLQRFADRGYFDLNRWMGGADPAECILIQEFAEN